MPVKLLIPERTGFKTPFTVSFKSRVRPWLIKETRKSEQAEREALMRIVLICTTLWGGFWLQFVIAIVYNLPAIHTLSSGNWFYPTVDFYLGNSGPFPWALAGTFVMLSIFGAVVGLVGAWIYTRESRAKWRMRFAVGIFAIINVGWSLAGLAAEDAAWKGLEKDIAEARGWWRSAGNRGDEWELRLRSPWRRWNGPSRFPPCPILSKSISMIAG